MNAVGYVGLARGRSNQGKVVVANVLFDDGNVVPCIASVVGDSVYFHDGSESVMLEPVEAESRKAINRKIGKAFRGLKHKHKPKKYLGYYVAKLPRPFMRGGKRMTVKVVVVAVSGGRMIFMGNKSYERAPVGSYKFGGKNLQKKTKEALIEEAHKLTSKGKSGEESNAGAPTKVAASYTSSGIGGGRPRRTTAVTASGVAKPSRLVKEI